MPRFVLPALLVSACAAGTGTATDADGGCTYADCDALTRLCAAPLPAEPDYSQCAQAGAVPAGFDTSTRVAYCVAACNLLGAGDVAACAGANRGYCATAPAGTHTGAAIALACPLRVSAGAACLMGCQRVRDPCDNACPTDDYASCAACRSQCGLQWAACINACAAEATDGGTPDAG